MPVFVSRHTCTVDYVNGEIKIALSSLSVGESNKKTTDPSVFKLSKNLVC